MAKQLDHISTVGKGKKFPLSILVHHLKSPFNVGGLFRLADGLGIEALYLSGLTPQPPNRKISKTSRATESVVYYEPITDPIQFLKDKRESGYKLIALELCDDSIALQEINLPENSKICLILGEENFGVNQGFLDLADLICHIPMQGQNSSMNVVSACAIASYALISKLKE